MSVAAHLPPVGSPPIPGKVVEIRRLLGHYVEEREPVVDVLVGDVIVTVLAPITGKIIRLRGLGEVVQPGEPVTEVTRVGTPTWELFVAYRRADSGYAGRIGDSLINRFGAGQVFKDLESLNPAEDFVEVIRARLQRAVAMVVVIGRQWLKVSNQNGPRIHDPDDFHREEIRTALERGLWVCPALVGGAQMPSAEQLPTDIHGLSNRNAIEISDSRWKYDMLRLSDVAEDALAKSPRRHAFLAQVPPDTSNGWQWIEDDPTARQ